jgi:peptidyl-prolyl cis-trans isomerase NIMA-interacting 1
LEGHRARIQSGSISLAELAASESDCSSARKHGDLGFFGHGEMQPAFENAAFKLKVGELSPIVSSDSGLHLIERVV